MSMPNIPNINPNINIVRDDAINMIMASIAMEELALAHILNAEGEKLQYVLGTLEGRDPGEVTICDVMAVNNSIHKTLRNVIKEEMLLQLKLEDAIELSETESDCQLTIRGRKTWRDNNDVTGQRPPTVDINLIRDDVVYQTVTVDSTGDGSYSFACLPIWRDATTRYTYRVDEAVVPTGYSKTVSGYNIINTIDAGEITISGRKVWNDNNNEDGDRQAIEVILLQNGVEHSREAIDTPDVEDESNFGFIGVPQFDPQGNLYVYTVTETEIPNYTRNIEGFVITNTHV